MIRFRFYLLLLPFILFIYIIGILVSELPIEIQKINNDAYLFLDNNSIKLASDIENINRIVFARQDNLRHEFQIDGSDSLNNYNYQEVYFKNISENIFYKIYNYVRGGELYSTWKSIKIIDKNTGKLFFERKIQPAEREIYLPIFPDNSIIRIILTYPEKPVKISFFSDKNNEFSVDINRNERYLRVSNYLSGNQADLIADVYFPKIIWPYAGENLVVISRIFLTGILIIVFTSIASMLTKNKLSNIKFIHNLKNVFIRLLTRQNARYLIFVFIVLSLLYVLYISYYLYQGMPHVLDAITYFNQAKIFASGQLYASVTRENMMLGGPFMNAYDGKWFMVFGPGTSFLLAIGFLIKAPWIVMPVMGALSLAGVYMLGKRWYGQKIALFSLVLIISSPFYSFISGSYLSHTATLFFIVFSFYFWNVFCAELTKNKTKYIWLILSAVFLGIAFLVREAVSVMFGIYGILALITINYKKIIKNYNFPKLFNFLVLYSVIFSIFPFIYFLYNRILTGSIFVLPRWLFHSGDKYGFGEGIGFYGQHNPAAGLVILEQLLTSLQFELFGWIYPFTLAFIAILFLLRRANKYDLVSLGFVILIFAMHVPYYYHSIAIGPRHLYEGLPFFVFLTSRGIAELINYLKEYGGGKLSNAWPAIILVVSLFLYNIFFYTPRKIELYNQFTGLPSYEKFDSKSIYENKLKNAVVITDNWLYYFHVLSAMNDPMGRGEVLYVYLPNREGLEQMLEIYKTREIYMLRVENDGRVYFDKMKLSAI